MIGKLIFSSNPQHDLSMQLGPYQIIHFGNEERQDALCGSIMLPPYSIMSMLIESEDTYSLLGIAEQYLAYLHTPEPMSFIVGLLALLLKGISVIFLIDSFDAEFSIIPQTIQRFLNLRYGMFPENNGNGFLFPLDPMYTDQIYSDLFMFDYCDLAFLQKCHSSHPFNAEVNNKIIRMGYMNQPQYSTSGGLIDPFQIIGGKQ